MFQDPERNVRPGKGDEVLCRVKQGDVWDPVEVLLGERGYDSTGMSVTEVGVGYCLDGAWTREGVSGLKKGCV